MIDKTWVICNLMDKHLFKAVIEKDKLTWISLYI